LKKLKPLSLGKIANKGIRTKLKVFLLKEFAPSISYESVIFFENEFDLIIRFIPEGKIYGAHYISEEVLGRWCNRR